MAELAFAFDAGTVRALSVPRRANLGRWTLRFISPAHAIVKARVREFFVGAIPREWLEAIRV